jgi:hypothetical protein
MGQGEEIRWRWTRGGDPPKMGQGEDSRRPAGVLGGGGVVASLTLTSGSHLSDSVSIRVQLAISAN